MNSLDYQPADDFERARASSRWLKISAAMGFVGPFFGAAIIACWAWFVPRYGIGIRVEVPPGDDHLMTTFIVSCIVMGVAAAYLALFWRESRRVARGSTGRSVLVLILLVLYPVGIGLAALPVEAILALEAGLGAGAQGLELVMLVGLMAAIGLYCVALVVTNRNTLPTTIDY